MTSPVSETQWIDLNQITLSDDARAHSPEDFSALVEDMRLNGQLQEIVVAPLGAGAEALGDAPQADASLPTSDAPRYTVLAGVGRYLAAKSLNWEKIRCQARAGLTAFEKLHITFSENEAREDVSPLYQTRLLRAMQESGGLDQTQLAERIGKSQQTVSAYLSLKGLAPAFFENTTRVVNLGLKHFLELIRLPEATDQLALAEEAVRDDLSVRALKLKVDQLLKAPRRRETKPSVDPLSATWETLRHQSELKGRLGAVSYQKGEWTLHVKPGSEGLVEILSLLSSRLREVLAAAGGTPAEVKPLVAKMTVADLTYTKVDWSGERRLPSTPAEVQELEALAAKGPAAVYGWIFGPDNVNTRLLANSTWADLGAPDPVTGCRALLAMMRPNEANA